MASKDRLLMVGWIPTGHETLPRVMSGSCSKPLQYQLDQSYGLVRPVKIYIVVNGGCNPLGSPRTKRGSRPSLSSKHILQKKIDYIRPHQTASSGESICPTQTCSIGREGICCVPGKYANQSPKALLWLSAYRGCTTKNHVLCRDYFLSHWFRPLSWTNQYFWEYHKGFVATAQVSMSSNDRLYRGS